jgi:Protein of unknown function (DUF3147)
MTRDVVTTVVQAVAGGVLVVAFALVGQALEPKRFAGLFSAAPSIAIAGLVVTVLDLGDRAASSAAVGMLVGAAGFVAFSVVVRPLMARMSAVAASLVGCCAWIVVAVGGYLVGFR